MTENIGSIAGKLTLDGTQYLVVLDRAKEETRRFGSVFNRVFSGLPAPVQRAGRSVQEFASRINSSGKAIGNFSSRISGVSRSVLSFRSALAAAATTFGGVRLVRLAAEADDTRVAFRNLSRSIGVDSTEALDRYRAASRGTISDLQLMRQVNTAVVLGVAGNVESFEKLINAARILGKATGRTAAEGFRDLSVGIGRQSRLVLDNLGIIISADQAYRNYAQSIGKSTDDLTVAERRTAFLNEALRGIDRRLEQIGDVGVTFADTVARIRAGLANFASGVATAVTPALQSLLDSFQRLGDQMGGLSNLVSGVLISVFGTLRRFIEDNGERIRVLISATINLLTKFLATLAEVFRGASELLLGLFTDPGATIANRVAPLLDGIRNLFIGLGKAVGAGFVSVFIESLKPLIQAIASAIGRIPRIGDGVESSIKSSLESATDAVTRFQNEGLTAAGQGLTSSFLEGILGIGPDDRQELLRTFENIDRLSAEFFAGLAKQANSPDISAGKARQTFEEISEVLNTTSEDLAQAGSELVKFRGLLNTLRSAQSAGTFTVEGADARDFLEITTIIENALKRRVELTEEEAARAKELVKDNKELKGILDDIVGQLRTQATALSVVDLPKEEAALVALERSFNTRLADLNIVDEDAIRNVQRQMQRLLALSRLVNQREQERAQAIKDAEKARREEEASAESLLRLTQRLTEELKGVELDTEFFNIDDQTERDILELVRRVDQEIEDISLIKPEEEERIRGILSQIVAARRELGELERRQRQDEARRSGGGILQDFGNEAAGFNLNRFDQARRQLQQDLAAAQLEITSLEIPAEEQIALRNKLNDLASNIALGIDLEQTEANIQPFVDSITSSLQGVGQALVSALSQGEDVTRAIAESLASQLSRALTETIDLIGEGLTETFKSVFRGISEEAGKALSGIFSAAVGIIGAIVARSRESGSTFTEANIDDLATSQSVVRGVVAGPSSIPVAEVGSSLKEAFRTTEGLLGSIEETIRQIASGAGSGTIGLGQGAIV